MWFGKNGKARPRIKNYLSEAKGVKSWSWWTNKDVGNNQEAKKAMNYKLTWGMISNYLEGKSSCRAAFTIHNTTNQKLGNKGWAIFYSQSPRRVTNHSNSNANINQINGDWYSITPNESFSLPPGDQITIQYDMSHFIIKETDAPLYPYLVFSHNYSKDSLQAIYLYDKHNHRE